MQAQLTNPSPNRSSLAQKKTPNMTNSPRIHGTGIFTEPWIPLIFYGFHVGKYIPFPWIRHGFCFVEHHAKVQAHRAKVDNMLK